MPRGGRRKGHTVDPVAGCWNYNGHIDKDGYAGLVKFGNRLTRAPRRYYIEAKGPIPDGLEIDHLCRNRRCVNPAHLEAVTRAETVHRSLVTKAKPQIAESIRRLKAMGLSHRDIGFLFQLSSSTIHYIVTKELV